MNLYKSTNINLISVELGNAISKQIFFKN